MHLDGKLYLTSDGRRERTGQSPVGEFVVRRERRADALILWLSGVLDRVTSTLLEREIDVRPDLAVRVVIDLTELAFIDASGLDTLMRIQQRVDGGAKGLSFRLGAHVARHPLGWTRAVAPRSPFSTDHAALEDEDSYLALAVACADVDHLRPRDRPRGTSPRLPRQAAGTSDASPLLGVARAGSGRPPAGSQRRHRPLHRMSSHGSVKSYLHAVADVERQPDAVASRHSGSVVSAPEGTGRPSEVESRLPAA
jgi:hypothetical protein